MQKSQLSVAVLVSAGLNPVSGAPRAARGDAVALSLVRRLGGKALRVLHAGSPDDPALEDYLALGAGEIEVVAVPEGNDVAAALADAVNDTNLVVTGSRAEQGAGSGLLPYALAKRLGRPVVANVLEARVEGGEAHLVQFLPRGKRRKLAVKLPAVVAVHPMAPATIAYAHAARMSGRVATFSPPPGGEGLKVGGSPASRKETAPVAAKQAVEWKPEAQPRQIVRLKAEEKKPAHARLEAAIASEKKGGLVVTDGTPADKARIVLDYLARHGLFEP